MNAGARRKPKENGPFLKWAGGKSRLLSVFDRLFPPRFGAYHEPFLGAGAVYFHLALGGRLEVAHLSDANPDLISTYVAIRDELPAVLRALRELAKVHDADRFYEIRERFNQGTSSRPRRAAELIYLNKTGFNGLYRVNKRGEFNVPFGRYLNPTIFSSPQLQSASAYLKRGTVECRDFSSVERRAQAGDLVYFDPPYDPLSRTASFTSYARKGFGPSEQEHLAEVFRVLDKRGVFVLLSNHDTPLVRDLFEGCERRQVRLTRAINSRPERRGELTAEVVMVGATLAAALREVVHRD